MDKGDCRPSSSRVQDAFDPFYIEEEEEEKEENEEEAEDEERDDESIPNLDLGVNTEGRWQSFSPDSESQQINQFHRQVMEQQRRISGILANKRDTPSIFSSEDFSEPFTPLSEDPAGPFSQTRDSQVHGNNMGRTEAFLRRISKSRQSLTGSTAINMGMVPDEDGISADKPQLSPSTSFPDREAPLEFLKVEREKEQDASSGDIFLKLVAHSTSEDSDEPVTYMRRSLLDEPREPTSPPTEQEPTLEIRPVKITTSVDMESNGIEVVDSASPTLGVRTTPSYPPIAHPRQMHAEEQIFTRRSSFLGKTMNSVPEQQESPFNWNGYVALRQQFPQEGTTTYKASTTVDAETNNVEDVNEPVEHTAESIDPLLKIVAMAAPKLGNGTLSLGQSDSIRKAAERLGVPLESTDSILEPAEEMVQVPLNVEIRKSMVEARTLAPVAKQNGGTGIKDLHSFGSLLDSMSEVSSNHTSTFSGQEQTKHLRTIELKNIHSGLVSAVTFSEHPSECSSQPETVAECSDTLSKATDALSRPYQSDVERVDKPQTPNRARNRTQRPEESLMGDNRPRTPDRPHIVEKPLNQPSRRQPTKGKPLGASLDEIEYINRFLKIAGPDFDGSQLSIGERENLHDQSLQAGIPEDFINRLLDQSAGIIAWEQRSVSSSVKEEGNCTTRHRNGKGRRAIESSSPAASTTGTRSVQTKDSVPGISMVGTSYSEFTYDEEGFHRKTPPKKDSGGGKSWMGFFKNLFFMDDLPLDDDDLMEDMIILGESASLGTR